MLLFFHGDFGFGFRMVPVVARAFAIGKTTTHSSDGAPSVPGCEMKVEKSVRGLEGEPWSEETQSSRRVTTYHQGRVGRISIV